MSIKFQASLPNYNQTLRNRGPVESGYPTERIHSIVAVWELMSRDMRRASQHLRLIGNHLHARNYHNVLVGSKYSSSFKQYLQLPNGEIGSYFHDVPLDLDVDAKTCNMIVEVPRWSNGKFEISKTEPFNPITQDIKKGKPRFVNNIFPYHGYIHNYGAIPQTWEQPLIEVLPGFKGDNDPLDCCEIGSSIAKMGDIKKVKLASRVISPH